MSPQKVPISDLLAERKWLERLAHCLATDTATAKDLLQTTWVHAISHPPQVGGPVRRWLAEVMRNVWRATFRSDRRRRDRELAGFESDPAARSPEELIQEVEQRRRLIGLVLELDEPYRNVVLRHFYEGLSSLEIGRCDGTPASTVRWRLMEGLNQLRRQLDAQEDGQRVRWQRALLPLVVRQRTRLTSPWRWLGVATVTGAAAIGVTVFIDGARTHAGSSGPATVRSLRDRSVFSNSAIDRRGDARGMATGVDTEDCLAELLIERTELAETERKRQRSVDPLRLFEEGAPNELARATLLPIVTEVLAGVDRVPHSFDIQCRARFCKVHLLFDGNFPPNASDQVKQLHQKLRAHPELAARCETIGVGRGSQTKDALTGMPMSELDAMLRLFRNTAARQDSGAPEPATDVELRWPTSAAACQEELKQLRARTTEKMAEIEGAKSGKAVFLETPVAKVPELEAAMAASLKRVFGADAPVIEIYCRRAACRLWADDRVLADWHRKIHLDPWFQKHARLTHEGAIPRGWTKIYLAVDAWPE